MKHELVMRDGHLLKIEDIGQGYPIVFLHGNHLNSHYFKGQRVLSEDYRLIFIDTRGHGQSMKTEEPLTLNQLVEDLEEVLDKLAILSCLLVGHSDGANVALTHVQKYPKRVSGLLLNGGNFLFSALTFWTKVGFRLSIRCFKFLSKVFPALKKDYAIYHLLDTDVPIQRERLARFLGPVLVMAGEKEFVSLDHTKEIAALFPKGRLEILPKLGHNIANKDPEIFNNGIRRLISRIHNSQET